MKRRHLAAALALILLCSSCAPAPEEETSLTVSATEAPTSPPETEKAPTEETEEETSAGEDADTETTEETGLADIHPDLILKLTEAFRYTYRSYILITHTESDITISEEQIHSETDSELRVNGTNAVFRRSKDNNFEHLYLVKNELFRDGKLGKYRIGGYDKKSFIAEFAELLPLSSFINGTADHGEEEIKLSFAELSKEGLSNIRQTLGIGDEYTLEIKKSNLFLTLDKDAHMKNSRMELELTVSADGYEMMQLSVVAKEEQSQMNEDIWLELPRAEDHISFPDSASAALYEMLFAQISSFTSSHSKYEYTLRDDMHIKSESVDLPLSSFTTYAYNSRIGASMEKAFDIADGTGPHKILTHFNLRRGFSQIDGGSIFVDTTVNKNNLDYTLSRPFETSLFTIGNCTRTDTELSSDSRLAFLLNSQTAKGIAGELLLRAGIIATPEISETTAYTYIDIDANGNFSAIGYEFSAKAAVLGKEYDLSRSVRLEIVSRDSANVKVIYIEVEDDDEQ